MAVNYRDEKRTVVTEGGHGQHRSGVGLGSLLSVVVVLTWIAMSALLSAHNAGLTRRIDDLERTQKTLLSLCSSKKPVWSDGRRGGHALDPTTVPQAGLTHSGARDQRVSNYPNEQIPEADLSVRRRRVKRDIGNENAKSRQRKNKKSRKIPGVHFRVHVDKDKLYREIAEEGRSKLGNFSGYGFQPAGRIYKIWKPEKWANKNMFRYNSTTGKVTVKSTGLYLIYAQIMFHSPYVRKSFGIHIEDETLPYVEALSFTSRSTTKRHRRHVVRRNADPKTARDVSSYSQCSTMAVAYVKRNEQVFLKSLEATRSVIPQGYLTFWGLVKL